MEQAIVKHTGSNSINNIINTVKPKPKTKISGYTPRIQRKLNTYNFNNITVDDKYGQETHKALVKMYQYELNKQFSQKLVVDGIPGSKTDRAAVMIRIGARGNITYAMQAFMFFKGYHLSVDGIYGDITEEMIRRFQRDNRLSVDGIAGNKVFQYLIRREMK